MTRKHRIDATECQSLSGKWCTNFRFSARSQLISIDMQEDYRRNMNKLHTHRKKKYLKESMISLLINFIICVTV